MNNDFDKELREMASKSKIKESDILKEKVAKTYKNLKRKNNSLKKWMGTAAALIACTVIFSISFPAYAKEIPGIKQAMNFLSDRFEKDGYIENSSEVSYSVKVGEYTINVENIYYDGVEMSVFYNVTCDNKLDLSSKYWFTANLDFNKYPQYEYALEIGDFIDDNTFSGMMVFNISSASGKPLPKILNGEIDITNLNIQNIQAENKDSETQSLDVSSEPIKVSLDSSKVLIKDYEINEKIAFEGNTIEISGGQKYETGIFINKKDSGGNSETSLNYALWDSEKGKLKGMGGLLKGNGIISSKYELPSEDGEVKIVPYIHYYYGEFDPNENREDIHLIENGKKYDFGSYGTLEIKNIENKDNKTLITAKTTGYQSMFGFKLVDENIKQHYSPRYEENKNILGTLDMEVTYVFNKLDLDGKYYIQSPKQDGKSDFKILTDQIINLDIK
ncbi:MAG: DUF4179 domain-containing protein [Clostridium sp.]